MRTAPHDITYEYLLESEHEFSDLHYLAYNTNQNSAIVKQLNNFMSLMYEGVELLNPQKKSVDARKRSEYMRRIKESAGEMINLACAINPELVNFSG